MSIPGRLIFTSINPPRQLTSTEEAEDVGFSRVSPSAPPPSPVDDSSTSNVSSLQLVKYTPRPHSPKRPKRPKRPRKPTRSPQTTGSTVESEDAVKQYTYEGAFTPKYLNQAAEQGLVATASIPAGSLLFVESVIWISAEEVEACTSTKVTNELIARKVRAMGPAWFRRFLELSNPRRDDLGVFAGIWGAHQLPTAGTHPGSMLGLNLGWMNHSCVPNSALTVVNLPAIPATEDTRTSDQPPEARAVVRVCTDVDAGDELTIAYFYAAGNHNRREHASLSTFGFLCACTTCMQPSAGAERALRRYARVKRLFEKTVEEAVVLRPAESLQMAQKAITKLMRVGIRDARVAMLWTQCALLAGFHSDVARAVVFLREACRLLVVLEGPSGPFYVRVARWYADVTLMPGFAASSRGLSGVRESAALDRELGSQEILFMNGAAPEEYLRLRDYRRLPGCVAVHRGGDRYVLVAHDGKDPPLVSSVLPVDMVQALARARVTSERNRKRKMKRAEKVASGGEGEDASCDQERDFLDICRQLRQELLQKDPELQKGTPNRGPGTSRQSNEDLQESPARLNAKVNLIQTVVARKHAVVDNSSVRKCPPDE
ncbi:hypothetical protein BDV59DRAFT_187080 [Aspergillus ambiguus]|uniref:uncharacterized protein n=1 Tax=Aspergillus ambiguus TaxID=176160 RepID=UPI003CCE42E2